MKIKFVLIIAGAVFGLLQLTDAQCPQVCTGPYEYNTAFGVDALTSNPKGSGNTAMGFGALGANTSGYSNTAHGRAALSSNTGGRSNTALGVDALFQNTGGKF